MSNLSVFPIGFRDASVRGEILLVVLFLLSRSETCEPNDEITGRSSILTSYDNSVLVACLLVKNPLPLPSGSCSLYAMSINLQVVLASLTRYKSIKATDSFGCFD